MPKAPIIIYDKDMRKVAYLENAFAIGYEMPFNGLYRAQFSLPINDPKTAECLPMRYVEIYDGRERVELFRILPQTANRSGQGPNVTYTCEHVLATLLDDVMFQYHTIGNLGVYTTDVLTYILSKQSVTRWQLGDIQFNHQFEYNWENENLMNALFSVPKPFTDTYQWTYDTTVFPWRISLVRPSDDVVAYIRYGTNMQGWTKKVDPSNLCTRLYGLGQGEGVNQLTFADINGGVPYIEDAEAIAKYGVIARIFADTRFEYQETLLSRCQALLEELKNPRVIYTVAATEIHRLTGQDIYKFRVGAVIRVQDKAMGEDFRARIVKVSKPDLYGKPGDVELEIANRNQDVATTIADLASRTRIAEVYSQGATNLDSHDFADNADPSHPATIRFYIPEETARINKVMLSYKSEAFRAYERAVEAAPAVSSGPSSTNTTASAPATSSGPSSTSTTAAGGQTTSGPSSSETTVPSGGAPLTDTSSGGTWNYSAPYGDNGVSSYQPNHDHGISAGEQLLTAGGGYVTWVPSGGHAHGLRPHTHSYATIDHTHGMNHTHTIAQHVHGMDHTHQVPAHSHGMDHTHVVPAHTHGIEYGIFEGPTPGAVTVLVDGEAIPGLGTSADDVDIIPYLSKSGGGKIDRGWHEIKIAPDTLGRIVASINTQIFVQSRGGGNY